MRHCLFPSSTRTKSSLTALIRNGLACQGNATFPFFSERMSTWSPTMIGAVLRFLLCVMVILSFLLVPGIMLPV